MKPYKAASGERILYQATIKDDDETIKNIATIYVDCLGRVKVHNANGIEQKICPYLRYSCGWHCEKMGKHYDNLISDSDLAFNIVDDTLVACNGKCENYNECSEYNKIYMESEVNKWAKSMFIPKYITKVN